MAVRRRDAFSMEGMGFDGGYADDLVPDMVSPRESGGVTGGATAPPLAPSAPDAPSGPNYSTVGPYANLMQGYDQGKLNSDHDSVKYQIGRVFSHFDPSKGITGDLLNALNDLGLGTFSGSGDKLTLGGDVHSEFDGIGGLDDVIADFSGPGADPRWGAYTNSKGQAAREAARQTGAPPSLFAPIPGTVGGGSGSVGGGGSNFQSGPMFGEEVMGQLRKLFPDGAFNEDIVNRRTEAAGENLERFNRRRMSNNRAMLADKGLIGSGPEFTEAFSRESDIADQYSNAVSQIFANESENADSRMMQALTTAAGLSSEQANFLIDQFRANTERDVGMGNLGLGHRRAGIDEMLGRGNLALGNMQAVNNYNLGLANYGLARDQFLYNTEQGDWDNLLNFLQLYMQGAGIGSGGFV